MNILGANSFRIDEMILAWYAFVANDLHSDLRFLCVH